MRGACGGERSTRRRVSPSACGETSVNEQARVERQWDHVLRRGAPAFVPYGARVGLEVEHRQVRAQREDAAHVARPQELDAELRVRSRAGTVQVRLLAEVRLVVA